MKISKTCTTYSPGMAFEFTWKTCLCVYCFVVFSSCTFSITVHCSANHVVCRITEVHRFILWISAKYFKAVIVCVMAVITFDVRLHKVPPLCPCIWEFQALDITWASMACDTTMFPFLLLTVRFSIHCCCNHPVAVVSVVCAGAAWQVQWCRSTSNQSWSPIFTWIHESVFVPLKSPS